MIKAVFLLLISGWLCSCSTVKHIPATYVIQQQTLDSLALAEPDAQIVIYNIIPPEQKKQGISDENTRLLITGTFTSLSTFFAILFVNRDNNP